MVARRVGKGVSYLFAAGSAVAVAGLGAGVALLGFGPLSVDFLADDLAGALQRQMPGYAVAIGGADLVWDAARRGLAVRLSDVRFEDGGGETVLSLPMLAVDLDRQQLLSGALRPAGVAVEGARIAVRRDAAGRFDWAAATNGADTRGGWQALVDQAIAEGAGLRVIDIRDATVTLTDAASGGRAEVRRADLRLSRQGGAVSIRLAGAAVLNGRESPVELATVYRAAADVSVAVRFADLRPVDLAAGLALAPLARLAGVDVPLDGELEVEVGADGIARQVRYDLRAGAGVVAVEPLPQPARVASASARGRVDLIDGRVDIADLAVSLADGIELSAAGEVVLAQAGIGAALTARLRNLPTDAVAGYWPEGIAKGARRWVTGQLEGGMVTEADLRIEAAPGELEWATPRHDIVRLSFAFEGVEARYWRALPPLTGARGRATMDLNRFELRLAAGQVGPLAVSEGRVFITDLLQPQQAAEIEFAARGRAGDALALLDRPPLGFAGDLDLDPQAVAGDASVWAAFTVPLRDALALDDIDYKASAVLSRFAVPAILGRYAMSGGELSLVVDEIGIGAEGTAALNGLPVSLTWRRDFGVVSTPQAPAYPDRYGFAGTADVAAFKALGLDLTDIGSGPAGALVNLWIADTGATVATGEIDLTAAEVRADMLRWRKPPAAPANASFRLSTDAAGRLRLDDLAFVAGDEGVQASADFDPGPRLRRLYLPVLRLAGHDLAATVTWPGDGPVRVDVGGRLLDARPFLDGGQGEDGDEALSAVVNLAVDRLQLADATSLDEARGELSIAAGGLAAARLDGRLNRAAPVSVDVGSGEAHREVVLVSDDAGAVLRAFDVFEDAVGGRMRIRARVPHGDGPTTGTMTAADVQVRKAPLLAQVLSLGSIAGIQDVLAGEGVALRELALPFSLTERTLRIDEGRAIGPDIGLTIAGAYDRASDELDFAGTLVPTYTLNRILGGIPLIGDILVGREGEGVFAVAYRINGPADDPTVNANPLTALAPGILRRLVEGLLPPGAAAGSGAALPERERPNLR